MTLERFAGKVGHCALGGLAEWRALNRIKLYPGKVNRWLLIRAPIGSHSDSDLAAEASEVILGWFGDSWGDSELPRGRISLPTIEYAGATKPDTSSYPPIVAWYESLPIPPTLAFPASAPSSDPFYVIASFAYYGSRTDSPWPVSALMHDTPLFSLPYSFLWECPYGAIWTVAGVFEPGALVETPSDSNDGFWIPGKGAYQNPATVIGDRAVELKRQFDAGLAKAGSNVGKGLEKATSTLLTVGGLTLGAIGLVAVYKVLK